MTDATTPPDGLAASDAELLRAHVNGDPAAFGVLFARHRDRLWAVALRTMGNPHDAADGLQDGLIAAYRRAGSFRGEAAVTTWLHRVIVNACLDRLRAAKVRHAEALPDDLETHAGRGSVHTAAPDDPLDTVLHDERRDLVVNALATLHPDQRAAVVLVDMEGYSVAEAAEILGVAVGTVKSRCFRARAKLAGPLGVLAPPASAARGEGRDNPGNPPATRAVPPHDRPRGPPTNHD
ncbi:MAG: RNA polymerase sigma factor SigM [Nocardioides sp.]